MKNNKEKERNKNNNNEGVFIVAMIFLFFAIIFAYSKTESIALDKVSDYESKLSKISKEQEISKIETVFSGYNYHYITEDSEIEMQLISIAMNNIKIDNSLEEKIIVKLEGKAYIDGDNINRIRRKKQTYFGYNFYGRPKITTYMSEETYKKSGL